MPVSHYRNIFISFNVNHQTHLTNLVNSTLPICINQSEVLSVESGIILRFLKQVNKSESLDSDGLCFKFFDYDCPELLKHLQLLFQVCLAQSVVPDSVLSGCISPIVKRGEDPSACSNYRPMTMSCFVSKLFEYVLLPAISSKCNFTPFQLLLEKYGLRSSSPYCGSANETSCCSKKSPVLFDWTYLVLLTM